MYMALSNYPFVRVTWGQIRFENYHLPHQNLQIRTSSAQPGWKCWPYYFGRSLRVVGSSWRIRYTIETIPPSNQRLTFLQQHTDVFLSFDSDFIKKWESLIEVLLCKQVLALRDVAYPIKHYSILAWIFTQKGLCIHALHYFHCIRQALWFPP